MGTNKRYAAYYGRQTEERIIETFIAKAGPLQSLTPRRLRPTGCR
ncbi:hypothetical protein [Microbacterium sp. CH1]|nr:hypothetical protein [Microbacterium sp. CH1]